MHPLELQRSNLTEREFDRRWMPPVLQVMRRVVFTIGPMMVLGLLMSCQRSDGEADLNARPCGTSSSQPSVVANSSLRSLPTLTGLALMNPETLNGKLMSPSATQRITRAPLVMITGWAVDRNVMNRAGAVLVQVDNELPRVADYCGERPDVAKFYHAVAAIHSGFSVRLPLGGYKANQLHTVRFYIVNVQRTGSWRGGATVRFSIKP